MSAIIIVIVIAAVTLAIMTAIGTGPLALILVPLGVLIVGWLVLMGASRMRTGDVARRGATQHEFLGPGGPDDPDR